MDINPEIFFDKSIIPISFENTEKILSQMKNCICKIIKENGEKGTGFFCKIPYPTNQSKILNVLITNNHVLNEDDLKNNKIIKYTLKDDEEIRKIIIDNNKRKIYTSKELDISYIEIKENEDNINEYLEIDEGIIDKDEEYIKETYKNKSIYILHYPGGKDIVVSYGIIDKIKNEQINHYCNTLKGSSGSPILSLDTLKVIGIHCGSNKDENEKCNKGIFIKNSIKEFN
jgi:V8-like Glu-specific endopeptidase